MTFEAIYREIHDGQEPFPWQSEAARRLFQGEPLTSVNVPTASGKTAMIDAALYAAAHGGARRIAFIIDRRVVVDEAYDRALKIERALKQPGLTEFASRLGPIQVVRLRGGVYGDDDWVLYPDKVTLIVSTVDQVGSRLLHRGYGVSPRMAPLHAGFVGNEALYIVDEAHLSYPFIETVRSACRYGADVRLIYMTATPKDSETMGTVELGPKDRSHPILSKRLEASKIAVLIRASDKEREFVETVVSEAKGLSGPGMVVGIVVNRVNTARRVHDVLLRNKNQSELLTGRIRPFDRDRLMNSLFPKIRAGRKRGGKKPLFVVATQTIEVGADVDLDALVTEAAPLASLRQRFGRLDRLGQLGKARGVIVYRGPKVDKRGNIIPDPVYGMDIHTAWKWLEGVAGNGCVDFGISAMEALMVRVDPPQVEPVDTPTLLPSHVDLLAQTGPDAPYVEVSPWLHGAQRGTADVSIVWRSDLARGEEDIWSETVRLCPPQVKEALEVPLYAVKAWLAGRMGSEVADFEGGKEPSIRDMDADRPVLLWRGPDESRIGYNADIRPGDTIVVPAEYGGCDRYGWASQSKEPVRDIAELCSLEREDAHIVRLVPGLTGWLGDMESDIHAAVEALVDAETDMDPEVGIDPARIEAAHDALRALLDEVDHPFLNAFQGRFSIERHPRGLVLRGRVMDEVYASLNSGVAVELGTHLEGVARLTENLADGHPERERMVRAAKKHDLGKAEPRFQAMLHGDPVTAAVGPVLAKSALRGMSKLLAAYAESRLPRGFRHELASLSQALAAGENESDRIVRHLVATHHGYGRPWFPACSDYNAPGVDQTFLGSGWALSFAKLVAQQGPWSLAGMELFLRAADARQSKAEQEAKNV